MSSKRLRVDHNKIRIGSLRPSSIAPLVNILSLQLFLLICVKTCSVWWCSSLLTAEWSYQRPKYSAELNAVALDLSFSSECYWSIREANVCLLPSFWGVWVIESGDTRAKGYVNLKSGNKCYVVRNSICIAGWWQHREGRQHRPGSKYMSGCHAGHF